MLSFDVLFKISFLVETFCALLTNKRPRVKVASVVVTNIATLSENFVATIVHASEVGTILVGLLTI